MKKTAKNKLENACTGAIQGNYHKLIEHEGHELAVIFDGNSSVCNIDCEDCCETLVVSKDIGKHFGCDIEVIAYTDRVTVECLTCNKVIVVAKAPEGVDHE